MSKGARILVFAVIGIVSLVVLLNVTSQSPTFGFASNQPRELSYSDLVKEIEAGNVESLKWQGARATGELTDGGSFTAQVFASQDPAGQDLARELDEANVPYELLGPSAAATFLPMFAWILMPILFFVLIYFFMIRPAQGGGNQAMSFGKSKAKRANETTPRITFEDVAGIDEAKQELHEVVDFLKNTKRYVALGAKIPKGILLTGPPGVGKTHLARAIAGEAGVPFFHISGSDFVEMFVGVGAARVRDLFETAKAHRPCLIFVDEIDAVGRQRGAGMGGGHDEREQTLNQLLVEMDGFDANTGVIVIAATNRPDVLDPALLRPGRFDRHIVVDPPDATGREKILGIHSKGKPLSDEVNLGTIAKRSPGFTGADLQNALNEAALLAARKGSNDIKMEHVEEALDRVMAGPQRRSRVIDAKEREIIAYHEAGHAVVGEVLEHCDPVHKVTVLPRGMSLGSTWSLPDKDTYLVSKQELLDNVTMTLGGRVAEELIFNESFTGASNDLQRVAHTARAMVTEYGMSERLGTLAIGRKSKNPFLGRDYTEDRDYSEEVAKVIDEEVHNIVELCRQRAYDILTSHRDELDRVVKALLDRDTLDRKEFLAVMAGEELPELGAETDQDPEPETPQSADERQAPPQVGPERLEPGPA